MGFGKIFWDLLPQHFTVLRSYPPSPACAGTAGMVYYKQVPPGAVLFYFTDYGGKCDEQQSNEAAPVHRSSGRQSP